MSLVNQIALRSLNHLIQGESWATERLRQHAGASILLDVGAFSIRLAIDEQGLFTASDSSSLPDVTVTVPADAVGHAIFEREKLFSAVKLGGAADVAESFAFVLRNLRWDVESDLAQFVGDIPARRLNLLGNSLFLDVRNGFQKLAENFKEYAIEDSLLLAADRNIYDFGLEVNRIRDDVDRLEKRISKL